MMPSRQVPVTPPERALFAELTRLLQEMQTASLAQVETAIEDRFRNFLRMNEAGRERGGSLEITLTWGLPEGADSWAYYTASYRTIDAEDFTPCTGDSESVDNVVPFPDLERLSVIAGVA